MTPPPSSERPELIRRGLRLEYLTVNWNIIEGLVSVAAALAAGSVAPIVGIAKRRCLWA